MKTLTVSIAAYNVEKYIKKALDSLCCSCALEDMEILVQTNAATDDTVRIAKQSEDGVFAGYCNVGPDDRDCFQTGALVDTFIKHWGEGQKWINKYDGGPHEANFLKLDCSKLKNTFAWSPRWDLHTAIAKVVEWTRCWRSGGDVRACMDAQIRKYLAAEEI